MPDFEKLKPKTCLKKTTIKTIESIPFNLSTNQRGSEKKRKFNELLE